MRCPKCGHENSPETLFCEECDWRLDMPFRPEKKRNPMQISGLTFGLGIIALACGFIEGADAVAIALGALAMVIGGYAVGLVKLIKTDNERNCTILAGVGLVFGVVGFLMGFAVLVGALRWRHIAASTSWKDCAP